MIISAVLVLAAGGGVIAGLSGSGGGDVVADSPVAVAVAVAPPSPSLSLSPSPSPAPPRADEPPQPPPESQAEPDPAVQLAGPMQGVLRAFVAWAQRHAGEPCPTMAALGSTERDPWGGELVITCTDQPGSQRIGVISKGPDGELGSRDDVASWQLAREVTDLAHGARWAASPAKEAPPAAAIKPSKPSKPARKRPVISSDIPSER